MALSSMKVFNQQIQTMTAEMLAQQVELFNAASAGAIVLTSEGFMGDYRLQNFFQSMHASQYRADAYATNNTVSPTDLTQLQEIGVKVFGGFGPIRWEPQQLAWVEANPADALAAISRNLTEAIMKDQLNTAIAASVAAIEAQGTPVVFDAGTPTTITYNHINSAHAKFGDMSNLIVCDVMDGVAYHNLIGANLTNTPQLFQYGSVTIVDILGKRVVVTDAPALRETGTGRDQKVLGLVAGGVTIYDGSQLITNIETTNGKQRIETTFQANYNFGVAVKGYAWDTAAGGKSPTDAELATGSNWDKVATSYKHTAGVLCLAAAV